MNNKRKTTEELKDTNNKVSKLNNNLPVFKREEGNNNNLILSPLMKTFYSERVKNILEAFFFTQFKGRYDENNEYTYIYEEAQVTAELENQFDCSIDKKVDTTYKIQRDIHCSKGLMYQHFGYDHKDDQGVIGFYIIRCTKDEDQIIDQNKSLIFKLYLDGDKINTEEELEDSMFFEESELSELMKIFYCQEVKDAIEAKLFKRFRKETLVNIDDNQDDQYNQYHYEDVEPTQYLINKFNYGNPESRGLFVIHRETHTEEGLIYQKSGYDNEETENNDEYDSLHFLVWLGIRNKQGEIEVDDSQGADFLIEICVELYRDKILIQSGYSSSGLGASMSWQ